MQIFEKISIVGFGKVGKVLYHYFSQKGVQIEQVFVREITELQKVHPVIPFSDDIFILKAVDLILICVQDDHIPDIIQKIPKTQALAYTSGSVELTAFEENVGVFYPLQSFAHLPDDAIPHIPILLEAKNPRFYKQLEEFALRFFNTCHSMSSDDRKQMHIAAVIANNFTNHLVHLAQRHCEENDIDFNLLKPLLLETSKKWMTHPAFDLQTGPAKRGDHKTIEQQQEMLSLEQKDLYDVLTKSIHQAHKQ